jgi:hypothetical protein
VSDDPVEPDPEPDPEPDAEPDPEPDPEPEATDDGATDPEPEPEADSEPEVEADPDPVGDGGCDPWAALTVADDGQGCVLVTAPAPSVAMVDAVFMMLSLFLLAAITVAQAKGRR